MGPEQFSSFVMPVKSSVSENLLIIFQTRKVREPSRNDEDVYLKHCGLDVQL